MPKNKRTWRSGILWSGLITGGVVLFVLFEPFSAVAPPHLPKAHDTDVSLRARIAIEAKRQSLPAIDARIDPIWHAIPALDGVAVDEQKTYVASHQVSRLSWVYRPVKPAITLAAVQPSPVYRGNPQKKMVAFMINVAWREELLPAMLATLKAHNVKATFFLLGSWLREHPTWATILYEAGHEIGNHAYSHRNMSTLAPAEQATEMRRTQKLLHTLNIPPSAVFAPPSGDYNAVTVQEAWKQRMITVLWSIDTIDWKTPDATTIVSRVRQSLHPGALILMHPTTGARDALASLIRLAKNQHLELGTVSQLLSSTR